MGLFFTFLFLSLIIPQNGDLLIESYWAVALITLFLVSSIRSKQGIRLPRFVSLLWIGVLISLIISTFAGRSIAASIPTILRYLEGFATFALAFATAQNPKQIMTKFLRFGWALIGLFIALLLLPIHAIQQNGVIAINGHHPIAYYLLFLTPLFLWEAKHMKRHFIRMVIPVITLIISGARGALAIITLFLIRQEPPPTTWKKATFVGIIVTICFVLACMTWASQLPFIQQQKLTRQYPFIRLSIKETGIPERLEYAKQALFAVADSPLLGHGPGTFPLLSRQFESKSGMYSRYAHSFILETIAENGIAGSISIILLFGYIVTSLLHQLTRANDKTGISALTWGVLLTLLYSTFETNFNVTSLWLLWWAAVGFLLKNVGGKQREWRLPVPLITFILTLFTGSYFASLLCSALRLPTLAIITGPYRKDFLIQTLRTDSNTLSFFTHSPLTHFYKKDPDILALQMRYTEAIALDPYNVTYPNQYLRKLLDQKNYTEVKATLCRLITLYAPIPAPALCMYIEKPSFSQYLKTPSGLRAPLDHLEGEAGVAKFLYAIGLSLSQQSWDMSGTLLFWTSARDSAPEWGHFHLELASLQYYWLHDEDQAERTLESCMKYDAPRPSCIEMARTLTKLFYPGTLLYDIAAIPNSIPK